MKRDVKEPKWLTPKIKEMILNQGYNIEVFVHDGFRVTRLTPKRREVEQ